MGRRRDVRSVVAHSDEDPDAVADGHVLHPSRPQRGLALTRRQALNLDDSSMSGSPSSSTLVSLSGHTFSPIIRILSLLRTVYQNGWSREDPQRSRARLRYTSGVHPNLRYTWANGGSGREFGHAGSFDQRAGGAWIQAERALDYRDLNGKPEK